MELENYLVTLVKTLRSSGSKNYKQFEDSSKETTKSLGSFMSSLKNPMCYQHSDDKSMESRRIDVNEKKCDHFEQSIKLWKERVKDNKRTIGRMQSEKSYLEMDNDRIINSVINNEIVDKSLTLKLSCVVLTANVNRTYYVVHKLTFDVVLGMPWTTKDSIVKVVSKNQVMNKIVDVGHIVNEVEKNKACGYNVIKRRRKNVKEDELDGSCLGNIKVKDGNDGINTRDHTSSQSPSFVNLLSKSANMNHTNGRVNCGYIYENGLETERKVGTDLTYDDDIPLENTRLETILGFCLTDEISYVEYYQHGNVEQSWKESRCINCLLIKIYSVTAAMGQKINQSHDASRNGEKIEFLKREYFSNVGKHLSIGFSDEDREQLEKETRF
ncbi:hypothetical protein C2G38_2249094 [Gigaspora rosea]|uniref:Uncharacterized protein n=1 Tax=Gigaspora rosea TaxID=44941 RepID=A0A397UTT5_9GLOM|nr:hypothetical protein C2G38_2249094 [Gigaspora rosea]